MRKLVSIIIPIYNAEKTLRQCLESVINQTYQKLEIILINDGSTDNSSQICYEYKNKDSRIIVVEQSNSGVSKSRNLGLKYAGGDYIQFVDSDDMLDNTYIGDLVKNVKKYDLVMTKIDIIQNNDTRSVGLNHDFVFYREDFKKIFELKNYYGIISSPCNKLYKKSLIKDGFPDAMYLGEDTIFNLKYLAKCGSVKYLNCIKYNYIYCNQQSLTKKYRDNMLSDWLNVYRELIGFSRTYEINDKYCNRILLRMICSVTKALIKSKDYSTHEKKEIIKQMMCLVETRKACKNFVSYGGVEKIAFIIIKYKLVDLFFVCCKLMK